MRRTKLTIFFQLLLITPILLQAQSLDVSNDSIRIVDYEKRTVILNAPAHRIVSLVPSTLRILVQVGASEDLVGIDRKSWAARDSMLPLIAKPELASLPVVGDRKDPNVEAIFSLSPDLVITTSTRDKADALQAALGIPVLCVVSEPDEDYEVIRMLGSAVGKLEKAEDLIKYLRATADALKAKVADIPGRDRKRVYLALFTNSGKFTQTMPVYQSLKLAGGINVAESMPPATSWGSVEIGRERILLWDPDIVFLDWKEKDTYLDREAFISDPDFRLLKAVKRGRIHYSQTSHDGKDYAAALAEAFYMASILYPKQVPPKYADAMAEEVYSKTYGLEGYYAKWKTKFGIQ